MFVTTANSLDMPQPLLDRMEIIRLEGYTEDEKVEIAKRHLIPKQIEAHGLKDGELVFTDEGLRASSATTRARPASARWSARSPRSPARRCARSSKARPSGRAHRRQPRRLSRRARFRHGVGEEEDQIGAVTGLAWTEVGGELLTIEAVTVPGKGQIKTTGKLGEVMQESIQAAFSFVKARAPSYGVKPSLFARKDIHVHLPEGAVPKDGPSAGIGMVTAIISTLTGIPVRRDVAMTGEVTLRGRVLPIGGLKEKLLAALRGGIKTVLIPAGEREGPGRDPGQHQGRAGDRAGRPCRRGAGLALATPVVPIEWTEADELAAVPPAELPALRRSEGFRAATDLLRAASRLGRKARFSRKFALSF
jgi:ATP-dependent Lon protease